MAERVATRWQRLLCKLGLHDWVLNFYLGYERCQRPDCPATRLP